jgi:NAD(P)-dependent dehydrogenase (short-subunit alcohol dehydrogenase family)
MPGPLDDRTMRLEDQTVFVTGAGSGLGRQISYRAAEEGATVIVTDVDREGGEETAELVSETPGDAVFHELDVTDGAAFHSLVDSVVEEHGLDGIVNNAGVAHRAADTEDLDDDTLETVLDVNVRGVWNGCHAALPHLKAQGSGSIVNVASLAGLIGMPKQSIYSLTKGAVLNFTRAVAAEAGRHGVRANAVCPGVVDTPLAEQAFDAYGDDPEAVKERMARQYPLGRLGEPDDVARPAVFLLGDEASWITGHGLVIDGGYSIS